MADPAEAINFVTAIGSPIIDLACEFRRKWTSRDSPLFCAPDTNESGDTIVL
jgi:hypothetical protein